MMQKLTCLTAVALAGLAFTGPAKADGPHGGPSLGRDSACAVECRRETHICQSAAFDALKLCAQTTCGAERHAARDACGADPGSDACKAARAAAETCLQPCRDDLKKDLTACQAARDTCAGQCPAPTPQPTLSTPPATPNHTPPPHKDPQCVATCRSGYQSCLQTATGDATTCRTACQPLIDATRAACKSHERSAECRKAQQAALECLHPCGQHLRAAVDKCLRAGFDCAQACPDAALP